MTTRTALRVTRAAILLVIAAGFLWSLCFAWLYLFGDEGATPPDWRVPAVPAGATVVEEGMQCASGGCWWGLTVKPAPGQTPEELQRRMGLEAEERLGPTLTDPGYVVRGAHIRQGNVVVYVSYA
ncbi:hypothetical protein [Actinoplanes philippinensis]|uniref:hypothetical protein n=1 Tax=Actinoplanes philippinensis TaxID=35752 RepID=UPI0033D99ECD